MAGKGAKRTKKGRKKEQEENKKKKKIERSLIFSFSLFISVALVEFASKAEANNHKNAVKNLITCSAMPSHIDVENAW